MDFAGIIRQMAPRGGQTSTLEPLSFHMSDSDCLLHRQDGAHPASKTHSSPQHTGYDESNPLSSKTSLLISPIPSRKRIRCDSDPKDCSHPPEKMYKGHEDRTGSVSELPPSWNRDDQFYLEDGSCILLVEDTLFNVHRSILSKDSSSFRTMFSLPQADKDVDGRDDEHPIVLSGDSAEEFRHFLSALYALPHEVKQLTSPSGNLDHLIDITRLANKYSFKSLETWALDAIQDYVNRKPSPILNVIPSPHAYTFPGTEPQSSAWSSNTENQLTRLIRLAQLCQHDRLMATMITRLRQLMSSSVQYAYLAMKLSDELDLRSLRGAAYLEVMQKATIVKKVKIDVLKPPPSLNSSSSAPSSTSLIHSTSASSAEGDLDSYSRLIVTQEQQLRLLAGYYRLTAVWDKLRLTPPHFEHAISCGASWHQQGCTQSWLEWWKEKTRSDSVMNLGLADVIGRLKLLQKDYDRWGTATYMHLDCRNNAKRAIVDVIKRVEDALPDFFEEAGGCED